MDGALEQAEELQRRFGLASAAEVVELALRDLFPGRIAAVSSFGAASVVLLHLIAEVDPATPVLFIDTGRHFPETLEYRDRLIAYFRLKDVRNIGPTPAEVDRFDPHLARAGEDPDGCCAFRKVAPLDQALRKFSGWISGGKRLQTSIRAEPPVFEADGGQIKINPLANMTASEIADYIVEHKLPPHPLVARGYLLIGCAPCTSPVREGEDESPGRRGGDGKAECDIHQTTYPRPSGRN